MIRLGGGFSGLIAAAALTAFPAGAGAAPADDMKACAAVAGSAVRLACFDAAAKDVKEGDVAACAKVSSDAVRLACFDAAMGGAAPASGAKPDGAPGEPDDEDMARLEEKMRAREQAMNERIRDLERKAAEVERKAAEVERRAAAVAAGKTTGKTKRADPEEAFGSKHLDKQPEEKAEGTFGDREAEYDDPLTAEKYGKEARKEKKKDPDRVDEIRVKIVNIEEGPLGKVKVTLENGQVWKQIDSDRVRWKRNGENHAEIKRAFLGSFLMTINDMGAAIRVRRIK